MNFPKLSESFVNLKNKFGVGRVSSAIWTVEKFQVGIPSWIIDPFGVCRFADYMPRAL